jgi:hypothetical protein
MNAMKMHILRARTAVVASFLVAAGTLILPAEDTSTNSFPLKSYSGTVTVVDGKERTLSLQGFFTSKTFLLGDGCTYTFVDKNGGAISDLRPGQRVGVAYQEVHGVLVASRVAQEPMNYEGTVKACDQFARLLTMHGRGRDKVFQIAPECKVVIRGDKTGSLADVQPGHYITVTYEIPANKLTARKIAQTSEVYSGTVMDTALDAKIIRVKSVFDSRKFNLGDNCAIVVGDKINGQLNELKPGDKVIVSYDDINGINVANRIAVVGVAPAAETVPTNQ